MANVFHIDETGFYLNVQAKKVKVVANMGNDDIFP